MAEVELTCGPCNCGTGQKVCREVHRDTVGGPGWVNLQEGVFYVDCTFWELILCGLKKVTGRRRSPETPEQELDRLRGLKLELRNIPSGP
jgi:hypothetical protein